MKNHEIWAVSGWSGTIRGMKSEWVVPVGTHLITVDPSIRLCGLAVIKHVRTGVWERLDSSVIRTPPKATQWERIDLVSATLVAAMDECDTDSFTVVIEMPQVMGGNAGTAAANSGDTLILAALVGSLRGMAMGGGELVGTDVRIHCPTVSQWKGNHPKAITFQRVERDWGLTVTDDNECDALGIAAWWLRKGWRSA